MCCVRCFEDDQNFKLQCSCCASVAERLIGTAFQSAEDGLERWPLMTQPHHLLNLFYGNVCILDFCMACDMIVEYIPDGKASVRT